MKTSYTLLLLAILASVAFAHETYSHDASLHPSRSHHAHSQHSFFAPIAGGRPTVASTFRRSQAEVSPPLTIAHISAPVTWAHHPYPLPSLTKRAECATNVSPCPENQICCPPGSYCTYDALGNGACCPSGAVCTGLATSIRGSLLPAPTATVTVVEPVHGAANLNHPAKIFVALANLMRFGLALPAAHSNTPAAVLGSAATEPTFSQSGGRLALNGTGFHNGHDGFDSGTAGMPRPLKLFAMPIVLAKRLAAAPVPPVNNYQDSKTAPFGDQCGAPLCSAASHAMVNPFRYPVWLTGQVQGLLRLTKSESLHHEETPPNIHGLVPVSAHAPSHATSGMTDAGSISQPISLEGLEDSHNKHDDDDTTDSNGTRDSEQNTDFDDADAPWEVNISEKLGGYAPLNEIALNSTASSIYPFSLRDALRRMKSTMSSFGWTLARKHAIDGTASRRTEAANAETGCHDSETEVKNGDYAKNACEGLGVGSALIAIWGRLGA